MISDISQVRSHFSRESSHHSHDGRVRSSESPKKSTTLSSTFSSKKSFEAHGAQEEEDEDNCDTMKEYLQSPENSLPQSSSVHHEHGDQLEKLELFGETAQMSDSPVEQKDKETGEEIQFPVEDILPDSRNNSIEDSIVGSKEGRLEIHPLEKSALPEDLCVDVDRSESKKNQKLCGYAETLGLSRAEKVTANDELVAERDAAGDASAKVLPPAEKDTALPDVQKPTKDSAHRLSLPLNELIRYLESVIVLDDVIYLWMWDKS